MLSPEVEAAPDEACRSPAASGKTRAEVQAICYATNRVYRMLFGLELQCAAERKKIA